MAGTLKVKIQEDIILDNQDYGSKRILEISSIDEIYKRIITCPASQTTTIVTFGTNVYDANGNFDVEDVRYIRVTNLDSSNSVEIAVVGATLYQVALRAGHSHILGRSDDLMLAEGDGTPSFGTMADISKIACRPNGSAVSLEVFIASA